MTLVFMFPGQSSRYPGMLTKLTGLHPRNRELLGRASELLGRDLAAHYREDNPEVFARNRDVQIGVFLANHMFLQILEHAGLTADVSLGLSLGEYNHLVQIGALDFEQALRTVEERGEAYDAGPRGAMASVFPIELEALQDVARRAAAAADGVLEVVNLNSPRQHVLSGDQRALETALKLLEEEEGFVQAVVIERQVPMHCSTFAPVGSGCAATWSRSASRRRGAPTCRTGSGRCSRTRPRRASSSCWRPTSTARCSGVTPSTM